MNMQLFMTVFGTVFIAELGDKTQLATMLYAAREPVSLQTVFIAASLALVLSTAMGVIFGSWIGAHVPEHVLRYLAGTGFIAVGLWTLLRS